MNETKVASEWTKEPPTEGGWYWNWNGCEDCCPLPTSVMRGHQDDKYCFVTRGQLGLQHAIDCDEYGGWWLLIETPPVPEPEGQHDVQ